ncbi:methylaspartate mutase [Streptomyces sp. NPDC001904]|uniref:methylaspartate mutase n=1 Tax=Streptomyces sp. NPDC001904 TaxID=3154531 RepID=UPI0033242C96
MCAAAADRARPSFTRYVRTAEARQHLTVQPRMGFADPRLMREGLAAVRDADDWSVGTLTVDAYTRTGAYGSARAAVRHGESLNGYPVVTADRSQTRAVLDGIQAPHFPVQIRHGSAEPQDIVQAGLDVGIALTEGGPISYCLPYSALPLGDAVTAWAEACEILAASRDTVFRPHIESFGGCMLGQLCPPELLLAITVLEGMFFRTHGIRDISLSYAQQTHHAQDTRALRALRTLAGRYLPDCDWHVVLYTFMGLFPETSDGATTLNERAAALAVAGGAERLIVKTSAEAVRIPTIEENATALRRAAAIARKERLRTGERIPDDAPLASAAASLIESALACGSHIDEALVAAFRRGVLDVPYCIHPDNRNTARSSVAPDGYLIWTDTGAMAIDPQRVEQPRDQRSDSEELLVDLGYNQRTYDEQN